MTPTDSLDFLRHGSGVHRYVTLVLDLETGAVLFVGEGKSADSLVPFWRRLKRSRARIQAVAIEAQSLLTATPTQLTRPPSLARWNESYPTVEFMLPDLLLHHESLHIGQLSIWRRAAGLPPVAFPDRAPRNGLIG